MADTPPTGRIVEGAFGAAPTGDSSPPPAGPFISGSSEGGDWTVAVTQRIESVVGTLRDKGTVPITKIARAVVFGLVIAVMGVAALVLALIGVLRLHVYLPFHPEARRVWVTYIGMGAIFLVAGAFAWRKRTVRTKE